MKISAREMKMAWITLLVVLVGVTYWVGGTLFEKGKGIRNKRRDLEAQTELYEKIITREDNLLKRLEKSQKQIPVYASEDSPTPLLLKKINGMAQKFELELLRTQPEKEVDVGEGYEVAITCSWQGNWEAVVRFLYNLQAREVGYDVRRLNIASPRREKAPLKGTMTIFCVYRKSAPEVSGREGG